MLVRVGGCRCDTIVGAIPVWVRHGAARAEVRLPPVSGKTVFCFCLCLIGNNCVHLQQQILNIVVLVTMDIVHPSSSV